MAKLGMREEDLDDVVYDEKDAPPDAAERAATFAHIADADIKKLGVDFWGLEDHLVVGGRLVELIYVDWRGLLADVERAYATGLVGEAFVTAQFAYLAGGVPLADPSGALAHLRERLSTYPAATRRTVTERATAVLPIYFGQLRTAVARGDLLYVQHRRYTLQEVWFNLLFALSDTYHPGEKRLLAHAARLPMFTVAMSDRWQQSARMAADAPELVPLLGSLIDDICALAEITQ